MGNLLQRQGYDIAALLKIGQNHCTDPQLGLSQGILFFKIYLFFLSAQLYKSVCGLQNSVIVFNSVVQNNLRSEKLIFVVPIFFRFIISKSTNNNDDSKFPLTSWNVLCTKTGLFDQPTIFSFFF